jgi:hypothetical protein
MEYYPIITENTDQLIAGRDLSFISDNETVRELTIRPTTYYYFYTI